MTAPTTARSDGDRLVLLLPFGGLALLAAGLLGSDDGPVLCPFRLCTGLACPGCGLTRAVARLVVGDFAGSWRFHPLAGLLVIQVAVSAWLFMKPHGRAILQRLGVPVVSANAVAFLVLWAIRWRLGILDVVTTAG